MRPRAKYAVIHRHRSEYSVSTMCRFFGVSRSGYYDFVRRIGKPEKNAELAAAIRQQQEKSFNTYGYRRMCLALESKGIHCNPKTILRVMKKMICCLKSAVEGSGSTWDSSCIAMRTCSTGSFMLISLTENGSQTFRIYTQSKAFCICQ